MFKIIFLFSFLAFATTIDYEKLIADEAFWISTLQFRDGRGKASGAIAVNGPGTELGQWIRPYDANIGARGMLVAGPSYFPMVKSWMKWYLNHLNWPDNDGLYGTVYDYWVDIENNYSERPTESNGQPTYDSSDSYAATFLILLQEYAQRTGDLVFLVENQYLIEIICGVIYATKDKDGLTWAKPSYRVKYLMDNSEVYQGLVACSWIHGNVFNSTADVDYFNILTNDVRNGIENNLWMNKYQMYSPAKQENGYQEIPDWSIFSDAAKPPSAMAQAYPIQAGVILPDSKRAKQLWNDFNSHWPNWTETNAKHMTVCYATAVMKDNKVDVCLQAAIDQYTSKGHLWQWTVLESAMVIFAAEKVLQAPAK